MEPEDPKDVDLEEEMYDWNFPAGLRKFFGQYCYVHFTENDLKEQVKVYPVH